jgi:hypothetical protein
MFSRTTIWTGQQPQPQDIMQFERDAAKSLAQFVLDAMGSQSAAFTGLAATPGTGLTINVGAGAVYQYGQIDPTAWGDTLGSDTFEGTLLGLVLSSQNLTGFAAPTTSGQSVNYLIQCQVQVTDSAAASLPFYSSNDNPPTYLPKSPSRQNVVVFEVKAGTPATTGSQVTPTPDSGWIPLYAVTVDYGETSLTSADIALAANAPQFYGFVHTNPNGNTPVYLNPAAQQTGSLNVSGNATVGTTTITQGLLVGGAASASGFTGVFLGGMKGDGLTLTSTAPSLTIAGNIAYNGTHAGTDADPLPLSQLNVTMLGGKLASDYALASGHYLILYSGSPTADPTNVNAAIDGYFQANVAQGTAPIQVVSTTMCPNLNAQFVGGFAAGNASGNVPVSNGTLNVNLNAEYLNGKADTAFQPAGNYPQMNTDNTGDFSVSGQFFSYGGTVSQQVSMGYMASNPYGVNVGGPIAYINALSAPLALLGSSVRTDGALYVGDETPQNAYVQDIVPSGVVRSGQCVYTVTYGGTSNSHPSPGNGTAWGTYGSSAGQITVGAEAILNARFYIGYRVKVTLNASLAVRFQGLGMASGTVYVDNQVVGTIGNQMNGFNYTFSAGTHMVDIVYASTSMGAAFYEGSPYGTGHDQGGSLSVFGWLPFDVNGKLAAAITEVIPG